MAISPYTRKQHKGNGCVVTEAMSARQLTADDVKKADLIWVMTEDHKGTVLKRFPEAAEKGRLLGDLEIKDAWKSKLREGHLQAGYVKIGNAIKNRLSEISSLP